MFIRSDFRIQNRRNFHLECSLWEQKTHPSSFCVIYLHGNSSSRFESIQLLKFISKYDISLCSFDFSGCGLSEGDYISLGWHEKDDVELVVQHLIKEKNIKKICLWGRSMGSSAAILYSSLIKQSLVTCLVFDSPFCSLRLLSEDIAKKNSKAPKCIMRLIWFYLKKKILKKNNFNINDISPITHVGNITVPGFFISARSDKIIDPTQMKRLYEAFPMKKTIEFVEGDHNSPRPEGCLMKCVVFINTIFVNGDWDEKDLEINQYVKGGIKANNIEMGVCHGNKNEIVMIPAKKMDNDEKIELTENFEEEKNGK